MKNTKTHALACIVYEQSRKHEAVDETIDRTFEDKRRILNVALTQAIYHLTFRGTREGIEHINKGNFLSIIEMLSKYEPVLQELLRCPCVALQKILNELIDLLSPQVKDGIVCELRDALFLFFSVILDTTQNVSQADQLSEVYRYSVNCLAEEEIKSLKEKGLDLKRYRGQGYDGATVLSGVYRSVQRRIKKAPHAYIVHCAAHSIDLVLQDAVARNREITHMYCFFGHSIVRREELKTMYQSGYSKVTLKTLNATPWAEIFDAVSILKHSF
ncbi:hypothetical protein PR048_026624 [Dryococelus australis]|uniref:DUF4371 domain-containing protein n=1 Tax=Dryococelus australis TaxID=614101 RepID=A0ABQ9GLX5_9NEOP|nr:hypothetical protein PR048_026624 [Dryococelus australis]